MHAIAARVVVAFGVITALLAAGTSARGELAPSATTTTMMAGWEQKFKLDWTVEERGGARQILGSITSQYGTPAESMTLLAQALDRSGAVVGQRLSPVPGGVPGLGRVSFVIPGVPAGDHYRVTVWDYSLLQAEDSRR
jgi:hypothetical protein